MEPQVGVVGGAAPDVGVIWTVKRVVSMLSRYSKKELQGDIEPFKCFHWASKENSEQAR